MWTHSWAESSAYVALISFSLVPICLTEPFSYCFQQVEIAHAEMAGVKKSVIKAELAKKFRASEDRIAVVGIKPKYGGGRTSCFAAIYDDMDARNKYDTKTSLYRVSSEMTALKCVCPLPGFRLAKDLIV